jgi:Cu-processing system ATP-binding protein
MITARDLWKRFDGIDVLRGLDVTVTPERVTAIVGPNGAGKTTFIKSILGLTKPDSGLLLFDGMPIGDSEAYRRRIGYMPQIARFPENLTGSELLSFLCDLRGVSHADERLIDELQLRDQLGKRLRVMSGGTRQKINAAAAFLFNPDLLILDEPTSGLDPVSAGILKRRVHAERLAGRTIMLTSHVLSEVEELADDVVFLCDGVVRYTGELDVLKRETGQATLERSLAVLMTREAAA